MPADREPQPAALAPGTPRPTPVPLVPWRRIDPALPIDFHLHTTYTDGTAPVQDMAAAARRAGLAAILFSEHVRAASDYYPAYLQEVRAENRDGLTVFAGFEAKILDRDGTLDCPPAAAEEADAIVGSVHRPPAAGGAGVAWQALAPEEAIALELELALAIVERSRAHVLGHPMGMVVRHHRISPLAAIERLARACAAHGKAFELSARYCPSPSRWLAIVERAGCPVSLGSDAHRPSAVGGAWRLFDPAGGRR
ncbi:MAG: PHP domain-containing protein [Acidobacteria bacterium]|nr:MAG: PHP domain-containing protein [Acidobacteriota bacterium]